MTVVNGSLRGLGNYKSIAAPNTGTAAVRRYTFDAATLATGKVWALVTGGPAYYLLGPSASVDLDDVADSKMGFSSQGVVIDVSGAEAMSWFAADDAPTIELWGAK